MSASPNAGSPPTPSPTPRSSRKPRGTGCIRSSTGCCCIPWLGPLILFALLFVVFQAVFAWATPFADALEARGRLADRRWSRRRCRRPGRDLITDGIFAGVGSVVVFLPQIVILFFFILAMEASGYMARAAFLMDRMMAGRRPVGAQLHPAAVELRLRDSRDHGDAQHRRSQGPADHDPDRAADDLFGAAAGLCGDHRRVHPRPQRRRRASACRGWCCSGSTCWGSSARCSAALVLRRSVTKGAASGFIMELPKYQMPRSQGPADRAVAARMDFPAPRRHDHLHGHGGAVAAAQLPARRAGRETRSTPRSPAASPTGSPWWSSRSASTATSRSR